MDPQQEQISKIIFGPLLVMAPVGTGKTLVLTHRVINAIQNGVSAENILCLTFTNRAASEIQSRIRIYLPEQGKKLRLMTFHGFCAFLLRVEAKEIGVDTDYIVYDEEDSVEVLGEICKEKGFASDSKVLKELYYQIEQEKSSTPSHKLSVKEIPYSIFGRFDDSKREVIEEYHRLLGERHALDFADLIYKVRAIFRQYPLIKEKWAQRYDWIQVDEVQDTHDSEYEVIKSLAEKSKNIALFGDVDQTIYEWRGSKPFEIIGKFRDDFAPVEKNLETNYRSTRLLIRAVSHFAKSFKDRDTSNIPAQHCKEGTPIIVHYEKDPLAEAQWISRWILRITDGQNAFPYNKIGILTRTNQRGSVISRVLESCKIPHLTVEEYEFFRRQEIKDLLAYLKILLNPYDGNSLHRILLRPKRGIGTATLNEVRENGQEIGLRLTDLVLKKTFEGGEPYGFLLEKYYNGEVVVVDVETTDFSSPLVEVVEIAAIKVKEGQVVGEFHRYLKNSIPVGASERVHRISDEFLRQHGDEPEDVFSDFRQFITGNLLVGHNVSFDLRVVHEQASRLGIQILFDHWEDTLDISRRFILSERYDLEYLATLLGLKHLPEHRAKEDAYCTFDLLHYLTKTIKKDTMARGRVVSKYGRTFQPLANLIHSWRNQTKIKRPPELLDIVLRESGLGDYYEEDKKRISYINELRQIFRQRDNPELDPWTSLLELINFAALSRNIDYLSDSDNRIPIITLHQAKGLEFDVVFIAGASEGEIPHYYSVKEGRLEEEKRLFYVGLTRAKKNLIISGYRKNQWGYSKGSSQFISYLPNDAITRT